MSRSTDWDPLRELSGVQKRMNRLFEAALARTELGAEGGIGPWTPVADVVDEGDTLRIRLDIAGVEADRIKVRFEDDELVVEGDRPMERERPGDRYHRVERSYGKFARRFRLPGTVDRASVQATHRDGVLEISLWKRDVAGPSDVRVQGR